MDIYENDFIDDDDSYDSDSSVEENKVIKGENSCSDQLMEDDSQLHASYDSRKRKGRFGGSSSSEESSDSVVLTKKKKRQMSIRYLIFCNYNLTAKLTFTYLREYTYRHLYI